MLGPAHPQTVTRRQSPKERHGWGALLAHVPEPSTAPPAAAPEAASFTRRGREWYSGTVLYPQGPGTKHVKETSRKSSGQCSTEKAVEPALNTPTG